ncbi:MAG: hypothetical protein J6B68_01645 [Lachnospiraceae bacterium]|nr:hypothetical protein [Lachnospiraceae bacterium]MBP3477550.1 hypothetical protein [Lachnospiraceae bacterium]
MKKSKLAPIAGPASIILGVIGIITGIYIIGGILGIIGLILGLISYADTNKNTISYIGVILSTVAIAWTCIFYYLWGALYVDNFIIL